MKYITLALSSVSVSYVLLLFYAALSNNFGIKLPDNLLDHYLVILVCVISATLIVKIYKFLTNKN